MKTINKLVIALVALGSSSIAYSQINLDNQIKQLPLIYSEYIGNYTHDFTTYQGSANLVNLQTTGRVLDTWNVGFSINAGGAIFAPITTNASLYKYPNVSISGSVPTLFSADPKGTLNYQLLNETSGTPLFHPFTGETFSANLPIFDGIDLSGYGASAAVMPKLSMGIGFGTEISGMYLPGLVKSSAPTKDGGLTVENDNMMIVGVKHDVFHWIPSLHNRNYYLSLGATYYNMDLEVGGLDKEFADNNVTGTYFSSKFNVTGLAYNSKATGFEAMLTKSFNWIDFTVFGLYSKSESSIMSKGSLDVSYASEFISVTPTMKTLKLEDLINVKTSLDHFVYGASMQLNLSVFRLGVKYGYSKEAYGAATLGFVFGKKTNPKLD